MFQHLTDFSFTRSPSQAVGFYLCYLLLIVLAAGLMAGVASIVNPSMDTFEEGARIGGLVAVIAVTAIAIAIVIRKKLTSFAHLLLIVVSGLLAVFGGGLFGLIPVAWLTTQKVKLVKN